MKYILLILRYAVVLSLCLAKWTCFSIQSILEVMAQNATKIEAIFDQIRFGQILTHL